MRAYYNEHEPFAAAWLENLINAGHIAPGDVDRRSIVDVKPGDLRGYGQCHFFAGIGGWSLTLRMAGVRDSEPVWTGSCPCQPFSAAGKRKGVEDERHLWPEFFRLIGECRPATVFGEQVASRDGREWLARVRLDLETLAYAVGAADLCAASVGAPHIRQRLYWVADASDADGGRRGIRGPGQGGGGADGERASNQLAGRGASSSGLGDANNKGRERREVLPERADERTARAASLDGWGNTWLECADGFRRVEPAISLLANGVPGRVGRIRAYGNAIVPQVAAQFVTAFLECRRDTTRRTIID